MPFVHSSEGKGKQKTVTKAHKYLGSIRSKQGAVNCKRCDEVRTLQSCMNTKVFLPFFSKKGVNSVGLVLFVVYARESTGYRMARTQE